VSLEPTAQAGRAHFGLVAVPPQHGPAAPVRLLDAVHPSLMLLLKKMHSGQASPAWLALPAATWEPTTFPVERLSSTDPARQPEQMEEQEEDGGFPPAEGGEAARGNVSPTAGPHREEQPPALPHEAQTSCSPTSCRNDWNHSGEQAAPGSHHRPSPFPVFVLLRAHPLLLLLQLQIPPHRFSSDLRERPAIRSIAA